MHMKKRFITYLFKGIIVLGSAGVIHGIATKILGQNQPSKPQALPRSQSPVSKNTSLSKNALIELPVENHQKTVDVAIEAPQKNPVNGFIIKPLPTMTTQKNPDIDALQEKHRKNYKLPRIYTMQISECTKSLKDDIPDAGETAREPRETYQMEDNMSSMRDTLNQPDTLSDRELFEFMRLMHNAKPAPTNSYSYDNGMFGENDPYAQSSSFPMNGKERGRPQKSVDDKQTVNTKKSSNNDTSMQDAYAPLAQQPHINASLLPLVEEDATTEDTPMQELDQEMKNTEKNGQEKALIDQKDSSITPTEKEIRALVKRAEELGAQFEQMLRNNPVMFDQTKADAFLAAQIALIDALKKDSKHDLIKQIAKEYENGCRTINTQKEGLLSLKNITEEERAQLIATFEKVKVIYDKIQAACTEEIPNLPVDQDKKDHDNASQKAVKTTENVRVLKEEGSRPQTPVEECAKSAQQTMIKFAQMCAKFQETNDATFEQQVADEFIAAQTAHIKALKDINGNEEAVAQITAENRHAYDSISTLLTSINETSVSPEEEQEKKRLLPMFEKTRDVYEKILRVCDPEIILDDQKQDASFADRHPYLCSALTLAGMTGGAALWNWLNTKKS